MKNILGILAFQAHAIDADVHKCLETKFSLASIQKQNLLSLVLLCAILPEYVKVILVYEYALRQDNKAKRISLMSERDSYLASHRAKMFL